MESVDTCWHKLSSFDICWNLLTSVDLRWQPFLGWRVVRHYRFQTFWLLTHRLTHSLAIHRGASTPINNDGLFSTLFWYKQYFPRIGILSFLVSLHPAQFSLSRQTKINGKGDISIISIIKYFCSFQGSWDVQIQ
jgi:hypothetical protein